MNINIGYDIPNKRGAWPLLVPGDREAERQGIRRTSPKGMVSEDL